MMNKTAIITILIILLFSPVPSQAVEQAAKITDREIVESLVEIKTTQKMILQRFEQVDKRFEELRTDMNGRFTDMNERFADMRIFSGLIISLIIALFGYMIWDRRTLMKPLEERIIGMEREFEIGGEAGNKLKRLIEAFRELSKEDKRVESVLRQFHLL